MSTNESSTLNVQKGTEKKPQLTEDVIERAFGHKQHGSTAPRNGTSRATRPAARIIMPTAKVLSDAASLQSAVQSVLPLDPRERLYYQPRRHLLQCVVQRQRMEGKLFGGFFGGGAGALMVDRFVVEYMNECVLYAVLAAHGGLHLLSPPDHLATKLGMRGDGVVLEGTFGEDKEVLYGIKDCVEKAFFTITLPSAESGEGGVGGGGGGGAKSLAKKVNAARAMDAEGVVGVLCRCNKGRETLLLTRDPDGVCTELAAVVFEDDADEQMRFRVIVPATPPSPSPTSDANGSSQARALDDIYAPAESSITRVAAARARRRQECTRDERHLGRVQSRSALVLEYERDEHSPHIAVLSNKSAEWDNAVRGYRLDFHGRAKVVSEKNFQLINASDASRLLMLFGKQNDTSFSVDFRYPLSGLQAAAVATTILHKRDL